MRIVCLGGYGTVARYVLPLAAAELDAEYVIAGRTLDRVREVAAALARQFPNSLFEAVFADAADDASLAFAFRGADLVVVTASVVAHTAAVARAVLEANSDWLDVLLSSQAKLAALRAQEAAIRAAGRCWITDGGFHPGLPAALIRFAERQLGAVESADVACYLHIDWHAESISPDSVHEFAEEIAHAEMSMLRDGKWAPASRGDGAKIDFGGWMGVRDCIPMALDELRTLPEDLPHLRNARFLIAGLHPLVDYVVFPSVAVGSRLGLQEPAEHLLRWALRRISKPPFAAVLQAEVLSPTKRMRIRVSHSDAYLMTAAPVAWCIRQWAERRHTPGLQYQARFVDPHRMLAYLEHCGVGVDVDVAER
jgi:saccharopine dehydrogenase (NAD+, L-lysine-forming)